LRCTTSVRIANSGVFSFMYSTNWAGRAFRRAVAHHAQESGVAVHDAAKGKAVSTENTSKIETNSNDSPVSGRFERLTSNVPKVGGKSASKTVFNRQESESDLNGSVQESILAFEQGLSVESKGQSQDMDASMDEMKAEIIHLLQLFGLPFVQAPAEAEAQCVMLEKLGLVDGIVTQDSDAFVFGGQAVYKNIFEDKKYVEVYNVKDAENEMNLTRDGMVGLAMLMGGDYTEGIRGVGIVNGMEIVQAFDVSDDIDNLNKFRKWLDGFDPSDILDPNSKKNETTKEEDFHKKHHTARNRWEAPKHFPDARVLSAYLNPVVDTSNESFSWGVPDLDRLLVFCSRNIGWTPEKTKGLLKPVLEKLEGGSMHQTRIDSFMKYEDGIKFAEVRSKRLRDVLDNIHTVDRTDDRNTRKKQKRTQHSAS
jgi:5'-3' exonuclease